MDINTSTYFLDNPCRIRFVEESQGVQAHIELAGACHVHGVDSIGTQRVVSYSIASVVAGLVSSEPGKADAIHIQHSINDRVAFH